MAFTIELDKLGSRIIRQTITGELNGSRQVDDFLTETDDSQDDDGNIINGFFNGFLRFGKSLLGLIFEKAKGLLSWSLSSLLGLIISTLQFIWVFDFNISDQQLDQQIDAGWAALAGAAGGVLGNAVGWILCGGVSGAIMLGFNEALALHVLANVGEEALDDIASNLANLINLTAQQAVRAGFSWVFKKVRRLLYPNATFGTQPWSFALQYQNFLESIENQALQNFVEEFFEEAVETCFQAGYVIVDSISGFYAQQKLAPSPLGTDTTVEVTLNRDVPANAEDHGIRNTVLVSGKSELIYPQIVDRIERNIELAEIRAHRQERPYEPTVGDKGLIVISFSLMDLSKISASGSYHQSEVSFRINENTETLTESQLMQYALRTKSNFAKPPYVWKKGQFKATLTDRKNGFACRSYYCYDEAEARKLINALYECRTGHNADFSKVNFSKNLDPSEAYDQTPPDEVIVGDTYDGIVRAPVIEVVARHCQIVFGSRLKFTLWDLTGKLPRSKHTLDVL